MAKKIIIILVLIILIGLFLVPVPAYRGRIICKIGLTCPPSDTWYLKKPVGWQIVGVLYCKVTQCTRLEVERLKIP